MVHGVVVLDDDISDLDLSHGNSLHLRTFIKRQQPYSQLQVLILHNNDVLVDQLAKVAPLCPHLAKLDVSRCSLTELPSCFHRMRALRCAYLHENKISEWNSVLNVLEAPNLAWVTFFLNPVAHTPGYRLELLKQAHNLCAIDYNVVCDDELVKSQLITTSGAGAWVSSYRSPIFGAACERSELVITAPPSPYEIKRGIASQVDQYLEDMRVLTDKKKLCSAATYIQRWLKNIRTGLTIGMRRVLRKGEDFLRRKRYVKNVIRVQRFWRVCAFKSNTNVKEMRRIAGECKDVSMQATMLSVLHKLAASKLQRLVRIWQTKRLRYDLQLRSSSLICRMIRGYLTREKLLHDQLQFDRYPHLYFSARLSWEMLVAVNTVRRRYGLPIYCTMEEFPYELTDLMAVRFPFPDEGVEDRLSFLGKLWFLRNATLARPMRQGRFPVPWDGPRHSIRGHLTKEQQASMCKIARRTVVNNYERRIFALSCNQGPHVIALGAQATVRDIRCPIIKTRRTTNIAADAMDFLDMASQMGGKPVMRFPELPVSSNISVPGHLGTKCFAKTAWLNQPLLRVKFENEKLAVATMRYIMLLNTDFDTQMYTPTCVAEKHMVELSAAVVIQSTWRSYCARKNCGGSVALAVLVRRAAVAIQRWYRWLPLKKRMTMLQVGYRYLKRIDCSNLFLEQRVFESLSFINSIRRCPDFMKRNMDFGIAILPNDMRIIPNVADDIRPTSLPKWFLQGLTLHFSEERDASVVAAEALPTLGLRDFVQRKMGRNIVYNAEDLVTIKSCSRGYNTDDDLQFQELNFPSVYSARETALAIFFCTYTAYRGQFAQLYPFSRLRDMGTARAASLLRSTFDLNWDATDRTAIFLINRQYESTKLRVIPIHGHEKLTRRSCAMNAEGEVQSDRSVVSLDSARVESRVTRFAPSIHDRSTIARATQLQRIEDIDVEDFFAEDHAPRGTTIVAGGHAPRGTTIVVSGGLPPSSEKRRATTMGRSEGRSDKAVARDLIAASRNEDYQERRSKVEHRRSHVKGIPLPPSDLADKARQSEPETPRRIEDGSRSPVRKHRDAQREALRLEMIVRQEHEDDDSDGWSSRVYASPSPAQYLRPGPSPSHVRPTTLPLSHFISEADEAAPQASLPSPTGRPQCSLAAETLDRKSLFAMSTVASQRWDDAIVVDRAAPTCFRQGMVVGKSLPHESARGVNHDPIPARPPVDIEPPGEAWYRACAESPESKRERIQAINAQRAHRRADSSLNEQLARIQNEAAHVEEQDALREDVAKTDLRSSYVVEARERVRAFRLEKQQRSEQRKFQGRFAAGTGVFATLSRKHNFSRKRSWELCDARRRVAAMRDEAASSRVRGLLTLQQEKLRTSQDTRRTKQMMAYVRLLQDEETVRAAADNTKRIRAARDVRLLLNEAKLEISSHGCKAFDAEEFEEYEYALRKFKDLSVSVKSKSVFAGESQGEEGVDESMELGESEETDEHFGFENFPITSVIQTLFNDERAPAPAHTPRAKSSDPRHGHWDTFDGTRAHSVEVRRSTVEGSVTHVDATPRARGTFNGDLKTDSSPSDYMPSLIPAPPPPLPSLKGVPLSARDVTPTLEHDRNLPTWSRPMTRVVMEIKRLPAARLSSVRKIRQTGPLLSAR